MRALRLDNPGSVFCVGICNRLAATPVDVVGYRRSPPTMSRYLAYLLGPELFWVVTCVLTRVATRRNLAPDPAVIHWLDRYWAVLPLVFVPLTFAFLFVPGGSRWWLLLRIDVAVAVGLAVATTEYCEGMTYHEPSSGPGAGTAWMVMLGLGYSLMTVGTVIIATVMWWRSRGSV